MEETISEAQLMRLYALILATLLAIAANIIPLEIAPDWWDLLVSETAWVWEQYWSYGTVSGLLVAYNVSDGMKLLTYSMYDRPLRAPFGKFLILYLWTGSSKWLKREVALVNAIKSRVMYNGLVVRYYPSIDSTDYSAQLYVNVFFLHDLCMMYYITKNETYLNWAEELFDRIITYFWNDTTHLLHLSVNASDCTVISKYLGSWGVGWFAMAVEMLYSLTLNETQLKYVEMLYNGYLSFKEALIPDILYSDGTRGVSWSLIGHVGIFTEGLVHLYLLTLNKTYLHIAQELVNNAIEYMWNGNYFKKVYINGAFYDDRIVPSQVEFAPAFMKVYVLSRNARVRDVTLNALKSLFETWRVNNVFEMSTLNVTTMEKVVGNDGSDEYRPDIFLNSLLRSYLMIHNSELVDMFYTVLSNEIKNYKVAHGYARAYNDTMKTAVLFDSVGNGGVSEFPARTERPPQIFDFYLMKYVNKPAYVILAPFNVKLKYYDKLLEVNVNNIKDSLIVIYATKVTRIIKVGTGSLRNVASLQDLDTFTDCWYYDNASDLLYVKVRHHSKVTLLIYWDEKGEEESALVNCLPYFYRKVKIFQYSL